MMQLTTHQYFAIEHRTDASTGKLFTYICRKVYNFTMHVDLERAIVLLLTEKTLLFLSLSPIKEICEQWTKVTKRNK